MITGSYLKPSLSRKGDIMYCTTTSLGYASSREGVSLIFRGCDVEEGRCRYSVELDLIAEGLGSHMTSTLFLIHTRLKYHNMSDYSRLADLCCYSIVEKELLLLSVSLQTATPYTPHGTMAHVNPASGQ